MSHEESTVNSLLESAKSLDNLRIPHVICTIKGDKPIVKICGSSTDITMMTGIINKEVITMMDRFIDELKEEIKRL